jgi:hypothetical protein
MSGPRPWGSSLDAQLSRLIEQDFARLKPVKPNYQARFDSGSLPDAATWEGCTIYCPDTQVFKGSNGSAWVNL